ncbi:MAG: TIGR03915 family putative DNA repair protein [Coriobacteriia bacterium]|nr:TIGR03915 family putative DNA repair protein [Coriobacteriia bacterium]MCL2746642.1 TIGR03915 family putative DNA repair protein [Coriobacteriia bacterium]MCL2870165.1 TIGR03915 family putative DNA repair protein [Coriobacteriia bacterium]
MLIYTYDNSLEGLLCCIFEAYTRKEQPDNIACEQGLQYQLEQVLYPVVTTDEHWQRVRNGIHKKLGRLAWQKIRACYCATDADKEMLIYRYLRQGFARGRVALDDISHPDILPIEELYRSVGMEQQRMIMFARFAKIESGDPRGIYCATINPKHSVLPLVMDHFSARFNVQPFVVYDEVHQLAGLSENGQWILSSAEDIQLPKISSDDEEYQNLWKSFYDAVCIPERINEKRRQAFMPKRLWKHLPEMRP